MDRGAWRVTAHGVTELDMTEWLSLFHKISLSTGRAGSASTKSLELGSHLFLRDVPLGKARAALTAWTSGQESFGDTRAHHLRAETRTRRAGPHKSSESVTQSCPTLCGPMNCSPPVSSVHRILQARILEWVAIFFSRGSSWPRNLTGVSCIAGGFFTSWATRQSPNGYNIHVIMDSLHFFKFENFYASKGAIQKLETQPTECKKNICTWYI